MIKQIITNATVGVIAALLVVLLVGTGGSFGGAVNTVKQIFGDGFTVERGSSTLLTTTAATTTVEAFTEGGFVYSTTTSPETNNLTLRAAEVQNYRYISVNPGRIFQTLTLPATSTITSLVPNSGDVARLYIRNATGTADGTFRIAAGSGFAIQTSSSTPAAVASTTPGDWATLTFVRKADTDIDILFEFFK